MNDMDERKNKTDVIDVIQLLEATQKVISVITESLSFLNKEGTIKKMENGRLDNYEISRDERDVIVTSSVIGFIQNGFKPSFQTTINLKEFPWWVKIVSDFIDNPEKEDNLARLSLMVAHLMNKSRVSIPNIN